MNDQEEIIYTPNYLRPELPPMPQEIKALRRHRGYPVPWFVEDVDGVPDFRVVSAAKRGRACREKICWVCGNNLGAHLVFVLGPMCCISRTSAEPPSHRDCATWSVKGCPFLTRPRMVRRDDLPEGAVMAPGNMLMRNPGVSALWTTKTFSQFRTGRKPDDWLIEVGNPTRIEWFREGRPATNEDIVESVREGIEITQKERPETDLATDPGFQESLRVFTLATGIKL